MTAEEFVAKLDAENQVLLRGLEPDATLKPEIQGALNVPNLLKVALATRSRPPRSPPAGWYERRPRGQAGVRPAGRRRGQALPADRRAVEPAGHRSGRRRSAGRGLGSALPLPRPLTTTVERVAAGQFTREAIAVVKNRQFIEFCERVGDRETAALYRDTIEPDERYHHGWADGCCSASPARPTPRRWRPRRPDARWRWRKSCSKKRWPRPASTTRRAAEPWTRRCARSKSS